MENEKRIEELAGKIHESVCRSNHVDACDWYYNDWNNPGYARKRFKQKAESLLYKGTDEQIMAYIEEFKKIFL